MTALVLNSLNYSTNLLEVVVGFFKKLFQGMMLGIMIARQTQANQHTASLLCKYEYAENDYNVILADLNAKTIAQLRKEFGDD